MEWVVLRIHCLQQHEALLDLGALSGADGFGVAAYPTEEHLYLYLTPVAARLARRVRRLWELEVATVDGLPAGRGLYMGDPACDPFRKGQGAA